MAQWSEHRQDEEKAGKEKARAEKLATILDERTDLFLRFRSNNYDINVVRPDNDRAFVIMPDDWPGLDGSLHVCHFRLKMPGASPSRQRNVAALIRLAKGLK